MQNVYAEDCEVLSQCSLQCVILFCCLSDEVAVHNQWSALQVVVRFVMSALLHTAYATLADTSYTFVSVTF